MHARRRFSYVLDKCYVCIKKKVKRMKRELVIGISVVCIALVLFALSTVKIESETYGFAITPDYFSEIPKKPYNFDIVQKLRVSGVIEDRPETIDEKYWKQVEWMPLSNLFFDAVENTANSPYLPWWCVGIYDAQMVGRIENIKSLGNDTVFTQRFWVRSVPGSMTNLGMKIQPSYPTSKKLTGSRKFGVEDMTVTQNPLIAKEYIRIRVLRVCSDSNNCEETDTFVLGPTLPKLDYNYVKEVWFEVTVSKEIPPDWYVVSLDAVAPSSKFTSDMIYKYLEENKGYQDPNLGQSCGIPSFSFFVEVKS